MLAKTPHRRDWMFLIPKLIIGAIAFGISIPFAAISFLCFLGGDVQKSDWLMDHSPFAVWFNYVRYHD
jgi:hypothetical protein